MNPKTIAPEIKSFDSPKQWRTWLEKNHTNLEGIWLRFFKKASGVLALGYDGALDEALCFGWIDGQVKRFDEKSWIQKFTPRRKKSIWSKRNIEHVARLTKAGEMVEAGLKAFEAAKQDGRLDLAYDSPSNAVVPEDFLNELSKDKKAKAFFETLNKSNKYAIVFRLQTAKKPETRERRMSVILKMLANGEKFH